MDTFNRYTANSRLSVCLLGPFSAMLDQRPITLFESNKVRALLAYLAVEADRPHSRDTLAGLLWPERPDKTAHDNLRQAIASLRRAIGDHVAAPPFLHIARDHVQFNTTSDFHLDVMSFAGLLAACDEHLHRNLETCKSCVRRLQDAASLYRGEFLEHFFRGGGEAFEEWVVIQRERLHRLAVDALYRLADYHERRGMYEQAQRYAARQLELDPWREEAHRQLMRALAFSGQRTAALVQYDKCRRILAGELGAEPAPDTLALYQQTKSASLKVGHSAPDGLQPSNLPTPTTPFVGREEEIGHITALLENPACRLLTLVGPGGIGKTRLALAVAAEQTGAFTHGVHFVSLAPLSATEFLVSAMADALGLAFYGPADPKAQLLSYLREKDMLIVLDSFEGLVSGAILLAEIIRHAPRVVLLVTSRERLGLQAEWVFDVQGLRYPKVKSTERLETYSAGRLFLQRAHMIRADFSLSQETESCIARICRMVEGMPLAIEIATAWLPLCSCEEIAQEIERNLDFLATRQPDVPPRHRSLRAAFDHSWKLLSEEERRAFRNLSVFRGGFETEAAEQVAAASLPLLTGLADKSLLWRNASGRYEMHELLRQYASDKLVEAGEGETVRRQHRNWYLNLAQAAEPVVWGAGDVAWLRRLEVEQGNLRAAMEWSLEHGDAEERLNLPAALTWFWYVRAYFAEGRRWLEQALATSEGASVRARRRALHRAAGLAVIHQDFERAVPLIEEALAALRELGFPWARQAIPWTVQQQGLVALFQGDFEQASALFAESLAEFQAQADTPGTASLLMYLGIATYRCGNYVRAAALLEESLPLLRELGDGVGVARALHGLGTVAYHRGNLARATTLLEESLAISQARDARLEIAQCLEGLAEVAGAQGRAEWAVRLFGAAEALREAIGTPLPPADRARHERGVAAVRAQLDKATFDAASAEGRAMTPEQAIAYALASD